MSAKDRIYSKLQAAFSPSDLQVEDESHMHEGHSGARVGGETHFRVMIVSGAFEGVSRVARQRLVHQALKEDLSSYIHALALDIKADSEK